MSDLITKLRSYHPTSGYSSVMRKAADEIEYLQAECERLKEHYGYLISAAQIAVQLRCKDIKDCFTTKAVTSPVAMDALKNALKQLQEVDGE